MGKKSSSKKQKHAGSEKHTGHADHDAHAGHKSHEGASGHEGAPSTESIHSGHGISPTQSNHKKWLITGLVAISLSALTLLGVFVIGEFLRARSISYYLPKETVGFMEINTDFEGSQWTNIAILMGSSQPELLQTVMKKVNNFFMIDFTEEVLPWIARRAGFALLPEGKTAIFLEVKDEKSALAFFEKRRLHGVTERLEKTLYRGTPIYEYIASAPMALVKLDKYLVIASDEETGKKIIDSAHDREQNLHGKKMFQNIEKNSSSSNLGFAFVHPALIIKEKQVAGKDAMLESVSPVIEENHFLMIENNLLESMLLNLAGIFSGESIQVRSDKKTLIIEHIGLFSDALLRKKSGASSKTDDVPKESHKKYGGNFIRLFPTDTKLFMGGHNAEEMIRTFSELTSSTSELFAAQVFGKMASEMNEYERKILLNGEYAMGYIGNNRDESSERDESDEREIMIALECTDEVLLKKLAKEIESHPEFTDKSLSLEIFGKFSVMTTDKKVLLDAKKRWNEKGESLRTAKDVEELITSQIRFGNDMIISTSERVASLLPAEWSFLKTFGHISLASDISHDGIKTRILLGTESRVP